MAECKNIDINLNKLFEIQGVRDYLTEVGGENCLDVISLSLFLSLCNGDSEKNKKLNLDLKTNKIRIVLNRLHNKGIVYYKQENTNSMKFVRYAWIMKTDRLIELITTKNTALVDSLQKEIEEKKDTVFFKCDSKCGEVIPFDTAFDNNFKCSKCNSTMIEISGNEMISGLEKQKKDITNQIKLLLRFKTTGDLTNE